MHIDDDKDLKGVVTGFCWRSEDRPTVMVSWMHSGDAKEEWFQPWRLTHVE